ncbi:MAG: phosphohistidine phosphatase SixA [Elainellaceae cyanobacterium]
MTTLYLIRHGIAAKRGTYAHDDERPLTQKGTRKTESMAQRLVELDLKFDLIQTSPLVRARQTAAILHDYQLATVVELSSFLAPEGNLQDWLDWLKPWNEDADSTLALVGHQPNLGNWAECLIWGASKEHLVVKKAGIIGLSLPSRGPIIGHSELFWLTPPRFLL